MKRVSPLIVLLLVLILLAVTNPSVEKHRSAVNESVGKQSKVAGALGVGSLFSRLFTYRDYVFFSLTTYEGKVRSVGLLGFVIAL